MCQPTDDQLIAIADSMIKQSGLPGWRSDAHRSQCEWLEKRMREIGDSDRADKLNCAVGFKVRPPGMTTF